MTERTIFTPHLDLILVGGLSFLCFAVCIAVYAIGISSIPSELVLWNSSVLTILVNGSHFIASYRLLYVSKELVQRYKIASIYLPAGLILYVTCALTIASTTGNVDFVNILLTISGLYLALHYTGQAWGMMASYAFLAGTPFSEQERNWLRSALRILAFWQMGWSLSTQTNAPAWINNVSIFMPYFHVLALATIPVGFYVFFRMYDRTGKIPDSKILIPYFVIHLWYVVLWYYPQGLFWVQMSHALQYLSFPTRVEFNRIATSVTDRTAVLRRRVGYFTYLIVVSFFAFYIMPILLEADNPLKAPYYVALVSIINIHHFFIDGCIWHLRNPTVKKDLFAHLPR